MTPWRKYIAVLRIAAEQAFRERADLYGRACFFVVILGVFSALWRAAAETKVAFAGAPEHLVWYLAASEWILLSTPARHLEIQEEVRRGDIAYQLARPMSYVRAQVAHCAGALLVRASFLGPVAFGTAFWLTGSCPSFAQLAVLIPVGLLASLVFSQLYVALGLLAFWLDDATPLFWVAGKLSFILGGLMLPLELYPVWLQQVARLTPFPSMLAGPAGIVATAHSSFGLPWGLLLQLLFWAFALAALAELLFWRAKRSFVVTGG